MTRIACARSMDSSDTSMGSWKIWRSSSARKRLAWARKLRPDPSKRPRNRPEVYAEQALYIHENPTLEIVLQAVRIGELGITVSSVSSSVKTMVTWEWFQVSSLPSTVPSQAATM